MLKSENHTIRSAPSLTGPQTNRVATLKQAFSNQFKSHFVLILIFHWSCIKFKYSIHFFCFF